MQERAQAQLDLWEAAGTSVSFRGSHVGYSSAGWKVVREIHCDLGRGALRVGDAAAALAPTTRGEEFCGRLHLAAGVEAEEAGPNAFLLRAAGQQWTLRFADHLRTALRPGTVSPSYGVATAATVVEYRFAAQAGREAGFSLERKSP
jgi:hypothetical protein